MVLKLVRKINYTRINRYSLKHGTAKQFKPVSNWNQNIQNRIFLSFI